jgi:sialate O-acetylesterase
MVILLSNWALTGGPGPLFCQYSYGCVDLGEWNDIHPLNKKDVAKRLALAAQKTAYNQKNIVSSGPIYESMKIENDSIIITFSDIGNGLIIKGGGEPKYFAVAGQDRKFFG